MMSRSLFMLPFMARSHSFSTNLSCPLWFIIVYNLQNSFKLSPRDRM